MIKKVPLTFLIDEVDQIVVTTVAGEEVTAADLLAHAQALVSVSNRPPLELVDFSEAREIKITMTDVRSVAEYLHGEDVNQAGSKLALVGTLDAIFGALRLFAAHREHPSLEIQVFRDPVEARQWLLSNAS